MRNRLSNHTNQALLAMLLGGDLAASLAKHPLAELFGFRPAAHHEVRECEALYMARPVIDAATELMSRALIERLEREDVLLSGPQAVRQFLVATIGNLPHEVFGVILLDAQNRLIRYDELFRGSLAQTSVYPREVVKHALAYNGSAAIFCHNHPSGVAEPSRADEMLTQVLKQALALVDVKVLDHLIVAGGTVLSFAERGLL